MSFPSQRLLRRWYLVLLSVMLQCLSLPAGASPSWALEHILLPEYLHPFDQFGHDVALDATTIAIGAPGDDEVADGAGAVYVFEIQDASVSFAQKLTPPGLEAFDAFGSRVAIHGDVLAVGTAASEVFVFQRTASEWTFLDQLATGMWCSGDLAVFEDVIAVGCKVNGLVFTRVDNAWSDVGVLWIGGSSSTSFGHSIAIWGDWIAVGDPDHMGAEPFAGAVAVFGRSGSMWVPRAQLTWPDSAHSEGSGFGYCVAMHEGNLLASARYARFPEGSWGGGRSYQLISNSWKLDTTFQNLGKMEDLFGHGCALHDHWVVFGAPESQSGQGEVYASGQQATGRGPVESLSTANSVGANLMGSRFGTAIAMGQSGHNARTHLIVGAPSAQSFGPEAGAALLFSLIERLEQGSPCSSPSSCESGYCVDGVCCNAPCDQPCLACSASNKGAGVDGICGVVPAGFDPRSDCDRSDSVCGADGACDGSGACRLFATSVTPCGSTECAGDQISGALCSGSGECVEERLAACAPYRCKGSSCGDRCDTDEDCAPYAHCTDQRCLSSASCDGDHTLLLANGATLDCSPYKCSVDGTCEQFCNRVQDCVAPHVCNRRLACVLPESPSSSTGCGCHTVEPVPGSRYSIVLLAPLLLLLGRRRRLHAPVIATLVLVSDICFAAPKWEFQQLLTSPGPRSFGASVAMVGDTVIIGAPGDEGLTEAGAVYCYRWVAGRWDLDQTLLGSTQGSLRFGAELALSEDTLAIRFGTTSHPPVGVEIFERKNDRWVFRKRHVLPLGWDFRSMGLQTDRLVLGDHREASSDLGEIFVLDRSAGAWQLEQTVTAPSGVHGFGSSLALGSAGLLATGGSSSTGTVHFLALQGQSWSQPVSIPAPTAVPWRSSPRLAWDGTKALLGPTESETLTVHVFASEQGSWQWEATLDSPVPSEDFGADLALAGATALVGAPDVGDKDPGKGTVFVFEKAEGSWSHTANLEPPSFVSLAGFGAILAVTDNLAAVGAPLGASGPWNLGLLFLFAKGEVVAVGDPCLADKLCATGHCVDGVCCATACDGVCEACSGEAKGDGEDGGCGPVAAGKDPRHDCPAHPAFPASCGADGTCDGHGKCRVLAEKGTPCGSTTCEDGLLRGRTCDGLGVCLTDGLVLCAPYRCLGDRCSSACEGTADCELGATCSESGVCSVASICDGAHTVTLDTGESRDCHPYVCQANGTCLEACNSVAQCVAPFVCDRSYRCVELKEQAKEQPGCWCGMASGPSGLTSWLWLGVGLGVLGIRGWGRRPCAGDQPRRSRV